MSESWTRRRGILSKSFGRKKGYGRKKYLRLCEVRRSILHPKKYAVICQRWSGSGAFAYAATVKAAKAKASRVAKKRAKDLPTQI